MPLWRPVFPGSFPEEGEVETWRMGMPAWRGDAGRLVSKKCCILKPAAHSYCVINEPKPDFKRAGSRVGFAVLDPKDLAWIHDVVGVDCLFYSAHDAHRLAVLGNQEIDLAAADAVLTGTRAVER